jgi:hypothetical protein
MTAARPWVLQGSLLDYMAAPECRAPRPNRVEQLMAGRPRHRFPMLIARCAEWENDDNRRSRQLPFFFLVDVSLSLPNAKVVKFAPRDSYCQLGYGVVDFFRDVSAVREAAAKLEDNRIMVVGLLVQMSEDMVEQVTGADGAVVRMMADELQSVGLGFNCRVPGWSRDFRALYRHRLPPLSF